MILDKFQVRTFSITCLIIVISAFFTYSKIYAQGRDRSRYQPISDTSHGQIDTSVMRDTTAKQPLDSTARIQNFKYVRKDEPYPQFDKPAIPFFLANAGDVKYNIEFDSSNNVIISEQLDGRDIKYPLKIPFDKYIKIRSRLALEDQFYKIVSEKYKIEIQDELEKLFKNISDITIPLPFSSETIFGPPTINLKINGDIDITASYQKTSTDQQTIQTVDQSQNNINFKQEVQVTAKGTIGDKLTIDADWNSQRTFDYENQLRLKYTGYPDEVVQKIEAGNVSLETKSNLIGSTQALFGIKGQFQLGPLTFTAIASQKKSEKKEVDITGGSQQTNYEIPAYQYSDNHFFLDTLYRHAFEEFYKYGTVQSQFLISKQVDPNIEVWIQTTPNNPNKRFAVCWDTLPYKHPGGQYQAGNGNRYDTLVSHTIPQIDGFKYSGYFVKLNQGEFTLNDKAGYITVNVSMPISPNDAVAVAYRLLQPQNGQITQYGTYSNEVSKDSLVLLLVHYPGLQAPQDDTNHSRNWLKKIKNIYAVGVKNIKNDPLKFTCGVYLKPASGTPIVNFGTQTYLTIDSLDLRVNGGKYYSGDPSNHPDNNFDFFPGYTIDLANGEVIFPTLEPFNKTLRQAGVPADSIGIDTLLYFASKTYLQNNGTNKFFIGGTAIGDASSHYSLGFNVVEGSVKVFNGSVQLVEGSDYTIDYSTGELVIRNQAALTQGSNLKIQYESNDLFSLASKTLLGARMEYAFNKTSYLGFTLINLQQQTLNDKVRIGEEPTNNTMMGFDGATQIKTNFLTKLVNKIPGYNTKEESTLDLRGEFAYMIPDPNTKKSLIPSDNGDAVAYIDDFEGAKKVIALGLNPLSWSLASIPYDTTYTPPGQNYEDSTVNIYRCKMEWYNTLNSVNTNDVYPNRSIGSSQSHTLTPMVLSILPSTPGMYTFIDTQSFHNYAPSKPKWTGIMKYLNSTSTNFIDENIGFIEIWMKLDHINPADSDNMFIDLGIMSEKVIATSLVSPLYPRDYHTEDINGTGVLDPQYDIGLDQMNYAQETAVSQKLGYYIGSPPVNTSGDQFNWTNGSTDYSHFNGLKGNAALSEGRKPDTEDLNGNGALDVLNNYFEYKIPLDTTEAYNKLITGGNPSKGWYQFKIPLNQYYKAIGTASLTNVQYIRMWFKGFKNDSSYIEIVDFNLLGNQWQKANRNDTSYSISVVNIEDNPDIYLSPVPGNVLRQSDQTNVDPNVLLNEQSMSVEIRNLLQGQGKFAVKYFNTKPIDLLNYKIIKLFVNGDPKFRYSDTSNYDAAVVVRLGSDSLNYYEYRSPIHPDPRPYSPWNALNEVKITFADLTQIKQLRDSVNIKQYFPVVNGPPGAKYAIIGNPTLSSLTLIALGVENNHNGIIAKPLNGSVWFDELRVLKTDDRSGYAYNFSAALKVADLAMFNFTYATISPTFHALEDRFGSRDETNNWEFSGTFNLHKVINSLLSSLFSVKFKDFVSLPITFSHSEFFDNPQFIPGTDIDLQTAVQSKYDQIMRITGNSALATYYSQQVKIAAQDLRVTNRISVNGMKFNLPGENFLIKEMLDKLDISYYWNGAKERSPTSVSKYTWDMGGSIGMNSNLKLMDIVHLDIGKYINLGDDYKNAKVYLFFPFMPIMPLFTDNIALGASFTRSRNDEVLRAQGLQNPIARAFNANRNFTLDWKFIENWIIDFTGNYSFAAGSDLTYLETTNDSLKRQRSNRDIYHDIFFHNGLINFGKDLSYTQIINMNPKFNIPGLKKFLDVTSSYRVQYGWTPSLTVVPGSAVGYTGDFQATSYLKLNQIFELFKSSGSDNKMMGGGMRLYQNDQQSTEDILKLLRGFIPDQLTISFSQSKSLTNSGVEGRPGFANFWVLFHTQQNYGPSRLYQLGWSNYPGKRAPNISLQDHEGYNNNLNISTFITPIFPNNLKISFTYKTSWSKDNLSNYNTDAFGNMGTPISISNTRVITRPSFIMTTNNQTIISKIGNFYNDPDASVNAKNLSNAFDKIVSFPFPSWDITLTGVEKFDLFSHFANAISIENSYSCDYKKIYSFNGAQPEFIQSQGIIAGFSPLIGINITFKEFQGGTLTASYKLNKTNNYDLSPSSPVINNTGTSDVSINASFTKSGFKLPLFGLSLDNDISIVFTYTRTTNDPRTLKYNADPLGGPGFWEDDALNGSISTTLNPSIQYALSKSVSLQVFYKYTVIGPTPGSVQIPTRKSNEAGLNLKLSIQ